jgi:toxin-antitoxin system PIN domain toxin
MTTDLPDINILLALHSPDHLAHCEAVEWFDATETFATTPITEAGLLRLLLNPLAAGVVLRPAEALARLDALKASRGAVFWPDDVPVSSASPFTSAITGYRQITDLHLLALAASKGGRLVTLDAKIEAALRPGDRKHLRTIAKAVG